MKRLTIGVIIDQTILDGGGFQASISDALEIKNKLIDEKVIFFTTKKNNISILKRYKIESKLINLNWIKILILKIRRQIQNPFIFKIIQKFFGYNFFEQSLLNNNVDLAYFLSPSTYALDLSKINFILRVWDISHVEQPEFPEVRKFREFENRENFFEKSLPKAVAIVVESEYGKNNISTRYRIQKNKIYVRGLSVQTDFKINKSRYINCKINIKNKYKIYKPYIFYPAQFWPHKNHVYIIEVLKVIREKYNLEFNAVFTGSDKGNLNHIKNYALDLDMYSNLVFPGFVDSQDLFLLYKNALALVMPSYFGPTNIPPIEAFEVGVPVFYSDIDGLSYQFEKAAILIDLNNPYSLADKLFNLYQNKDLRNKLITSGKNILYEQESKNNIGYMNQIIDKFRYKRITWGD